MRLLFTQLNYNYLMLLCFLTLALLLSTVGSNQEYCPVNKDVPKKDIVENCGMSNPQNQTQGGKYMFMVKISTNKKVDDEFYEQKPTLNLRQICTGSIVGDRFILTAASCIADLLFNEVDLYVEIGSQDTSYDKCLQTIKVEEILIHEEFVPEKYNDIALLKLEKKIKFTFLQFGYGSANSICLSKDLSFGSSTLYEAYYKVYCSFPLYCRHILIEKHRMYSVSFDCDSYSNISEFCYPGLREDYDLGAPIFKLDDEQGEKIFELVGFRTNIKCKEHCNSIVVSNVAFYNRWILEAMHPMIE